MTKIQNILFYLLLLSVIALVGCPPNQSLEQQEEGTFVVAYNKIYESSSDFDLRWKAVYPKPKEAFNPSINVSNKELAHGRCTFCHECGFKVAFDFDNYGKPNWSPHYKGQQWGPIVHRMNRKEGSMMNETVAERIFDYLRDVTLGKYDEAKDNKGAIVVEIDPDPEIEESSTGNSDEPQDSTEEKH